MRTSAAFQLILFREGRALSLGEPPTLSSFANPCQFGPSSARARRRLATTLFRAAPTRPCWPPPERPNQETPMSRVGTRWWLASLLALFLAPAAGAAGRAAFPTTAEPGVLSRLVSLLSPFRPFASSSEGPRKVARIRQSPRKLHVPPLPIETPEVGRRDQLPSERVDPAPPLEPELRADSPQKLPVSQLPGMVLSQLVRLANLVVRRGLQGSSSPRQKGGRRHLLLRVRTARAPPQKRCSA